MASEKQVFPTIPAKSWWTLRKRFIQAIPKQVTPAYLVTVLGGKEQSAKTNVLRGLQVVGLVDEEGFTTNKATLWRDDTTYPEVCKQILDELYPTELQDAVPDPASDREAAKTWFKATTSCGETAARQMTALYALLMEADPSVGNETKERKTEKTKSRESTRQPTPSGKLQQSELANQQQEPPRVPTRGLEMPEMRLSLEIRIDASVTPEQIDLIFASMAKHLYRRDDEGQ
ncbi:MAG: hypothetical protein F4Y80_10560 [Caldilineaceae bacterium SB0665_bin_21]|nr:hypothetical protein [Caldilineaceae bacterium SB0665_bin_21]MYC63594.1 hypothetical protein [Caldilineaceae bacterium SB0661_bin_34]